LGYEEDFEDYITNVKLNPMEVEFLLENKVEE
jgi:hypothetical protein